MKRFHYAASERESHGDLFDMLKDIKGMVRKTDPNTSAIAAKGVAERGRSKLQQMILDAFAEEGPMTDEELERLPQFGKYAQTTVSKRRTELYQKGELVETGQTRKSMAGNSPMKIWKLP